MNTATKRYFGTLVLNLFCGIATAQQAAPAAPAPANAPATAPVPTPAPTAAPAAASAGKSTPQVDAGEPRANGAAPPGGAPKRGTAADRLNLNTTTVTGDREQPKVMYVVPWKSANIGDLSGKPMNSLLDEVLAPVDREEFKREVAYYDAVTAPAPKNGEAKPPAVQGAR